MQDGVKAWLIVLQKGVCSTDASVEGEVEGEVISPTDEEMSLMMKAFTNMSSTSNDVLPNPDLADKLISVIKRKFKDGDVTLSLKDPCANLQMTSNGVAIVNTWVRSGNEHVTFNSDDMRPITNLARSQVLAAGFRDYGKGKQ